MTTIVLADDHKVVRQALRMLLQSEPGFEVVGEASNGREALEMVERLQPNVLVADLMMPLLGGMDVTREVRKRFPDVRVVILSMHADESYVIEAMRLGASAYVLKESTSDELVRAIHEAMQGGRYLSSPLSERAIDAYLERTEQSAAEMPDALTAREREILYLAALGKTNAEIARELVISPRTVETHRSNLMRKLGLHGQADLIRYALRKGILPLMPAPEKK